MLTGTPFVCKRRIGIEPTETHLAKLLEIGPTTLESHNKDGEGNPSRR